VTFLLDVNVLIALTDPAHVAHDDAHVWFADRGRHAWATCPITENGVLRILGNPKYPNSPGSPAQVAGIVKSLRALPGPRILERGFQRRRRRADRRRQDSDLGAGHGHLSSRAGPASRRTARDL
jgi:predicted nucleic acid-binding protein